MCGHYSTLALVFPPKNMKDKILEVKLFDQTLPVQTSTKFLGIWLAAVWIGTNNIVQSAQIKTEYRTFKKMQKFINYIFIKIYIFCSHT